MSASHADSHHGTFGRRQAIEKPIERGRAVAGYLRQLWFGLATYRLYPESPEQAGFVAAAEMIRQAAELALSDGPVDVEISPDGFSAKGFHLPSDASTLRLARVCFERRAERLRLMSPPSPEDLQTLFAALTTPVEAIDPSDGLESLLSDVTSVVPTRLGPAARPGGEAHDGTEDDGNAMSTATAFLTENLSGSIEEQAELVLWRLQESVSHTVDATPSDPDVYANLCNALVGVPAELRRAVIGKLVQQAADDLLAERLIGSLSNAELSRAIVDLGADGEQPVEIARRLAETGVRLHDIVDFTMALQAGFEDGATILSGLEQIGSPTEGFGDGSSVTEALARHLLDSEPGDLRDLHELSVAGTQQVTALGLATLQDYFFLEAEPGLYESVAEVWAGATREALLGRDHLRVLELVSVVEGIRTPMDGPSFLERYTPIVLDRAAVAELVSAGGGEEATPNFLLLAPFGESGVDVLFEELAEEQDRGRRAVLLGLLRQLAPGRAGPIVRRLHDPRWYVVRNAVNVLRHSRHPRSLDLLVEAARHAAEAVRREAVFGLVAGGEAALPHLGSLASGPDPAVRLMAIEALGGLVTPEAASALAGIVSGSSDVESRRRALEALARHPSPEAGSALAGFTTRSRPRLPRSLRRYARGLLRGRGTGAR